MTDIPLQLRSVVSSALGVPLSVTHTPAQCTNQIQILEQRKRYDLDCLLKTALMKISSVQERDNLSERALAEVQALQKLLRAR